MEFMIKKKAAIGSDLPTKRFRSRPKTSGSGSATLTVRNGVLVEPFGESECLGLLGPDYGLPGRLQPAAAGPARPPLLRLDHGLHTSHPLTLRHCPIGS